MQKIISAFAMTILFAACGKPTGSYPSTKKVWQADGHTNLNGWKCLLVGENAEKRDIFLSRKDSDTQYTMNIHEYDGELLSPSWMKFDGNFLSGFIFQDDSAQSVGSYMNGPSPRLGPMESPDSILKGYLNGNIQEGFTLLRQELIDPVTGGLATDPAMEKFAVIEDCREARGVVGWKVP